MAEPLGDPEDDGVARGRPAHLGGHLASRRVANLKLSALVALGREVDAHGDEPVVADIAVPGVPMPTGRTEPIHAPVEAADGATARDVHDELEEARVVRREHERSQGPTDLQAVLRADVPVRPRLEAAPLDRRKELLEERGLQEPPDHGAVALPKLATKLGPLGLRSGSELEQTRAGTADADHWRRPFNVEPLELRYRG
jgi:hypothetical protein